MSRRISGPVRELTAATRRIAAGDFEARVAASTRDELSALVASFNQMAGELARQRRDLERSNRLAAWTEMARQVAHEVKNPLTPIRLSAEHLRRVRHDPAVDFEETLETCTDVILRQVESLREIVTEFSSFARPPAPSLETLDLAQLLRETASPYAAVLSPDIVLELDLPGDALPVRGDRRLLERAVVNLLENALQAVGERGHVRVALAAEPDGWRRVEVEDSGPGVEPELRERIFEPFFSTKAAGGGLGLALVRRIAEDHGGTAALESEPGRPTRALLRLPPPGGEGDQPREV
jgi:nitrogen fixation/metabolism regulation signal transduction histidine kinase